MGYRLPSGGLVDRDRSLCLRFNGRSLSGYAGDTLASALIAADVSVVGRSFKYHRPRGIMGAREDDPNGLVDIGRPPFEEPNARAALTPLNDGLIARSINCWPSVNLDVGAILGLAKPFLPAGFYYKTFTWPSWHLYETAIRTTAGLGVAPSRPDPSLYQHETTHCDVLVVGGGPAGLAVASTLARTGAGVVLVEQDRLLGGGLIGSPDRIDGVDSANWIASQVGALSAQPNVMVLTRATATGLYDSGWVTVCERLGHGDPRERLHHIRARQVVLATGAHERPLVFGNNDRPGVMLAGAVATYALRYGVACGRAIAFWTNNNSAYEAAFHTQDSGANVVALLDTRTSIPADLEQACRVRGITLVAGAMVAKAHGRTRLSGISWVDPRTEQKGEIACDCLGVSGGWSPVVHLAAQRAGVIAWDETLACFKPAGWSGTVVGAGAINGHFSTDTALADAESIARNVAENLGLADSALATHTTESAQRYEIEMAWPTDAVAPPGKCWIDFLHDVTLRDVQVAISENFVSVEHLKRYTTLGMAPDQGKTSNVNGIAALAQIAGRTIPEVGTTRFRPPYTPVTLGSFAGFARGGLYRPLRHLALHEWHFEHGGRMEEYGGWLRPAWYAANGATEAAAINAEVLAVRNRVGLLDYSPLGKIDVRGPDAAAFLDRIYMNNVGSLKVGAARYGLMLSEDGSIRDDGVFCRLGEQHFMLTGTSGRATATAAFLERWHQCEWPHFDIVIQPLTTHWGVASLAGPAARMVIGGLASDIDFSAAAFPHMSVRMGKVEGIPVRVLRVSFSGELGYEINAPLSRMADLWEALMNVGSAHGIVPFGLEALMVMRTEKGFLHVGAETDSATLPGDMGFGNLGSSKTMHFIGRRSLQSRKAKRQGREELVGLRPVDGKTVLEAGGQVIEGERGRGCTRMQGRVTSGYWSPTLDGPVALGVVENGRARHGDLVDIYQLGETVRVEIVPPCFYDRDGSRMNA